MVSPQYLRRDALISFQVCKMVYHDTCYSIEVKYDIGSHLKNFGQITL